MERVDAAGALGGEWEGGSAEGVVPAPPITVDALHEHRTLVTNAGVLLAGQALGLVAPLITVPYLARVLGPAGWGPVLTAQALANWLIVVLEFAFDLSGTRAVARSRAAATGESMLDIVQAVQSAKLLLVLITVPVGLAITQLVPMLRGSPALIIGALAYAVFRGLSPLWYFQGIERVRVAVAVDSTAKVCAAVAVFLVVVGPADGWLVLALQAVFSAVSLGWLTWRLARDTRLDSLDLRAGWRTLRENAVLFACRVSTGLYAQANALILGAMIPAAVGFFGGAERIIRAAINLLLPMNQAVMPRVSALRQADPAAANRLVRRSFLAMGTIGGTMSAVAFFGAPILIRVLLGPAYGIAVPILRLLSPLPFIVAINTVLGIFWSVPFGHERSFLRAILAAGATNLILAALLVPKLGSTGMAIAAVSAEVVIFVVLMTVYSRESGRGTRREAGA